MPTFTEAEYKILKASVEDNAMLVKQLMRENAMLRKQLDEALTIIGGV
jgi:hypothetical protein